MSPAKRRTTSEEGASVAPHGPDGTGIRIDAGFYPVYDRLRLHFPESVDFPPGTRTALAGDNGLGKTSFLREVLAPRIIKARRRERLMLCWLDQDFLPQCHTVRAWLAAKGRALTGDADSILSDGASEADAALHALVDGLANAARSEGCGIFLVSDETGVFASLPPALDLLEDIPLTLVTVSHGPLPLPGHFRQLLFSPETPPSATANEGRHSRVHTKVRLIP